MYKGAFLPKASARSPLKTVHWTVFLAFRTPPNLLRLFDLIVEQGGEGFVDQEGDDGQHCAFDQVERHGIRNDVFSSVLETIGGEENVEIRQNGCACTSAKQPESAFAIPSDAASTRAVRLLPLPDGPALKDWIS